MKYKCNLLINSSRLLKQNKITRRWNKLDKILVWKNKSNRTQINKQV